ncbi:hypothetical protein ILYODFUR_008805 [Ilyodon furcidens]|uniref:Uncharacterized protein n=1 Tax=Ilyodon furcidens TaxID=33524 RepID=A0ABV0SYF6_9TELE
MQCLAKVFTPSKLLHVTTTNFNIFEVDGKWHMVFISLFTNKKEKGVACMFIQLIREAPKGLMVTLEELQRSTTEVGVSAERQSVMHSPNLAFVEEWQDNRYC